MTTHDHEHDHDHSELSETELRVRALETILTEKGYVDPKALDLIVETYETKIGPRNGARVVAKAWADAEYKAWLLTDATPAIASLGYAGRQGEYMVVVENRPGLHNLIVCTLCSCYPWPVLGLPPVWYKSAPYRSRAVPTCASSDSSCRGTLKSAYGIRRRRSATSCSPSVRPVPRIGPKTGLRPSSRGTR